MSYKSSVESSTQSSSNPSINPALQAALGSLDVQLEEELARYRRQRSGRPVMPPRGLGRNQIRKPLELISVNKPKSQTQSPVTGKTNATPTLSFPLALVNSTPTSTPSRETPREEMAQAVQSETPVAVPPEQNPSFVVPSAMSGATEHLTTKEEATEQSTPPETAPEGDNNIVMLDEVQDQPEDYLESSEKLLQSLDEQEPTPELQKRSTNRFLTPLSVGLALLLLLSSATVGYIFSNPSTMTALGLNRFFGSNPPTTGQSPAESRGANGEPSKELPVVEGPNLASDQFPDVNLNTLSQLQTSPTASPLPSPSLSPVPSVPDLPSSGSASSSTVPNLPPPTGASDLSSGLLQGTLQPESPTSKPQLSVAPIPTLPASQPSPKTSNSSSAKAKPSPSPASSAANATKKSEASASTTAEVASAPEAGDQFYYVLMGYGGDRSLEQARAVVPDAYLRSFSQGTRIQLGAFKRESEAKTLVEQLQRQGISASVHRP